MDSYKELRKYAKSSTWDGMDIPDQKKGIDQPPYTTPIPEGAKVIDLPDPRTAPIRHKPLFEAIVDRHSHRKFNGETMTLSELSYLLFCSQGFKGYRTFSTPGTFRTVPSAGDRHPIETFIAVLKVEGLEMGLYRYMPITNQLCLIRAYDESLKKTVDHLANGQLFAGRSNVMFIWAADSYRCEWRYTNHAHKLILLDVGHVCQNLYLACEDIGCGACAVAAYQQDDTDAFLELDGDSMYAVYMAPVGKINDLDESNKPWLR